MDKGVVDRIPIIHSVKPVNPHIGWKVPTYGGCATRDRQHARVVPVILVAPLLWVVSTTLPDRTPTCGALSTTTGRTPCLSTPTSGGKVPLMGGEVGSVYIGYPPARVLPSVRPCASVWDPCTDRMTSAWLNDLCGLDARIRGLDGVLRVIRPRGGSTTGPLGTSGTTPVIGFQCFSLLPAGFGVYL